MARIRSFEAPHKGLRYIISKFSYQLGKADIQNPEQLAKLKGLGHDMFVLLSDHVHTENEVTLKELEVRVPGSSTHDISDHVRLERIQRSLEAKISSISGYESPESIHAIYLEFSRFHSQYLEHIYEEETVTEILLQDNFTDAELMQHRQKIMQRINPSILVLWLKYIVSAQGIPESLVMLSGFRTNAPKELFDVAMNNILSEMDPNSFEILTRKLNKS